MCTTAPNMASQLEKSKKYFESGTDADTSRPSGRPVIFGDTRAGRHLMVVYEEIDTDTVYPVTAYEVPRSGT
jgi:hypothetical protein